MGVEAAACFARPTMFNPARTYDLLMVYSLKK